MYSVLKKFAATLLLITVLITAIVPMASRADSSADFRIADVSCSAGENVTLTLRVNTVNKIGGFSGRIVFDSAAFSYVKSSLKIINENLGELQANCNSTKKTVYFAWDSAADIKLSGELFSIKFATSSDAKGTYSFKLYIDSCYEATGSMKTIPYTYDKATCTISASSQNVNTAIEKINAAAGVYDEMNGKLTALSEARAAYNADINNTQKRIAALNARSLLMQDPNGCDYTKLGELITAAENAYNALTPSERLSVTDSYQTLVNVIKLYRDCKREIEIFDSESEVNNYKSQHSSILSKTQETVQISDKSAVEAAIEGYNNSSYAAKVLLHNEINLLKRLLSRIEALESDDSPTIIKRITEETIPAYKKTYEGILGFTDSDLNEENAFNEEIMKVVNAAYDDLNTQMMIDEGYEYLYQELFDKVSHIKETLDKLAGRSSKYPNVTRFNSDFKDLKKKTPDTITLLDRDEIMQAYYLIGMMSKEELNELGQDIVDKINAMVTAIGALELESDGDDGEDSEIVENTVIQEVISVISGGKETVYVPGKGMYQYNKNVAGGLLSVGPGGGVKLVKTAIIGSAATLLVFAVCSGVCLILLKRIKRREDEIIYAEND